MDEVNKRIKEAQKIIEQSKRYVINSEKLSELKEGKTETYLSTITKCTRAFLNDTFKGRRTVDKKSIIKILEPMISESVKLKNMFETNGMDCMINYFFKEI